MYRAYVDEVRTFGVEIEAFSVSTYLLQQALERAGIESNVTGYSHATTPYWKIGSDGSITGPNSFELVSPILSGSEGLEEVRKVMRVLTELGGRVNASCGFHVHWGVPDFTGKNVQSLLRLYSKFEPVIDYLVAPSRRGESNPYCRSLIKDHDLQWVTALDPRERGRADQVSQAFSRDNGSGSRYHKVNVTAYPVYGTVEFRQHQGTLSGSKAVNWILFTQQLVHKAKNVSVSKQVSSKVTLGELIRVLRLAEHNLQCALEEDGIEIDPRLESVRSWMKNRYNHFRQGLDDE